MSTPLMAARHPSRACASCSRVRRCSTPFVLHFPCTFLLHLVFVLCVSFWGWFQTDHVAAAIRLAWLIIGPRIVASQSCCSSHSPSLPSHSFMPPLTLSSHITFIPFFHTFHFLQTARASSSACLVPGPRERPSACTSSSTPMTRPSWSRTRRYTIVLLATTVYCFARLCISVLVGVLEAKDGNIGMLPV